MFIDTKHYAFVQELESHWQTIRDECLSLTPDVFDPWVQKEMYGDGWSVYGLIAFENKIEAALASCPKTAALLENIPGLTTAGFSRLAPGTSIKPHVGWVTTVYRLHLGLQVPPSCGIRVGTETRSWKVGECLIFDDTLEHEAWNRSDESRYVLLLDFLRPGMKNTGSDTPPESVQAMIQSATKNHE